MLRRNSQKSSILSFQSNKSAEIFCSKLAKNEKNLSFCSPNKTYTMILSKKGSKKRLKRLRNNMDGCIVIICHVKYHTYI